MKDRKIYNHQDSVSDVDYPGEDKGRLIEIRSEAVQEILGRPPRWIIRWGITVLFLVIGVLLIGSYYFSYPEIIPAQIVITTKNLPVQLFAKTSGRIDTLFVKDKQGVSTGDFLSVIDNPASFRDVLRLKEELAAFHSFFINFEEAYFLDFPANLQLGDLQQPYFSFLKSYKDYRAFVEADYHRKKVAVIRKQIAVQNELRVQSEKQLPLKQEQLSIAAMLYSMDSTLYTQRALSLVERERTRSSYLQSQQDFENTKTSIDNMQLSILQLEQSIFDVQQGADEQWKQLQIALLGAFDNLQALITIWEESYMLKSPLNGNVAFTQFWQKHQYVRAGDVLLTVIPQDDAQIIGKIFLPIKGAGKVQGGQDVNIKLDNFPYMEFGVIKVKIENISAVPATINQEKQHMLEVSLPFPLITNYGIELVFTQEMQGTAEIITDNRRLIERLVQPIRMLYKQFKE